MDTAGDASYVSRAYEYIAILGLKRDGVPVVDYIVYITGIIDAIAVAEEKIADEGYIIIMTILECFRNDIHEYL